MTHTPGKPTPCATCGTMRPWNDSATRIAKLSNWGKCPLHEAAPDLLEALDSLTEAAKEALIKGSDEVCQLPMCGEAGGHTGWCPISIAQECLDAIDKATS